MVLCYTLVGMHAQISSLLVYIALSLYNSCSGCMAERSLYILRVSRVIKLCFCDGYFVRWNNGPPAILHHPKLETWSEFGKLVRQISALFLSVSIVHRGCQTSKYFDHILVRNSVSNSRLINVSCVISCSQSATFPVLNLFLQRALTH